MKRICFTFILLLAFCSLHTNAQSLDNVFPTKDAKDVNIDTHIILTFNDKPTVYQKGMIKIFDVATKECIDCIDMSKPAGPEEGYKGPKAPYTPTPYDYSVKGARPTNANTKAGTPSGVAIPTSTEYQLTIIGGFTDGFHFHPIIVKDNKATVYLHNNMLQRGKTYRINIDRSVFGTKKDITWNFSTKKSIPANNKNIVVDSKGNGDFNTVQGALDYVPDNAEGYRIYVKNGDYEEIVYFRNKKNLTIEGESREGVYIHYANNEVFNPHPSNVSTNEWPGTFPSRRAAFAIDNCTDITMTNLSVATTLTGQAEGLLVNGERIRLINVNIKGSGDALQTNGLVYYRNCLLDGGGDTILGRGTAFFKDCFFINDGGPFTWIRNTKGHHGDIFLNCKFTTNNGNKATFAREPINKGFGYPYAEAVMINCTMENIHPEGLGTIDGDTSNMFFAEYNSRDFKGNPIDVSQRHTVMKQLDKDKDAVTIKNYSTPSYILDGWNPE